MTAGTMAANTISRASPVIRDSSVVAPTTAVLRKKPRFIGRGGLEASWGRHGTEAGWQIPGGIWLSPCLQRRASAEFAPLFWSPPARGQYQVSRKACPSDREAPSAQRRGPIQAAHRDQERRQRRQRRQQSSRGRKAERSRPDHRRGGQQGRHPSQQGVAAQE